MAIPTTYTELKAEIPTWLKRDDLTDDIETMIKIGEARINRISFLEPQETTAAVVMTANQNYTTISAGLIDIISLTYDDDAYEDPVKVPIETLDLGDSVIAGIPSHYAISGQRYYWNFPANDAYELTARYWKKWDIATDSTNWLLTNHPDVYIYTALEASALFMKHPMHQMWKAEANRVIDEIQYQSSRLRQAVLRVDPALIGRARSNIFAGY